MKKICSKCTKEQLITEFAFKNKIKEIRRAHCNTCHSKWFKTHYATNKQYYIDKSKSNRPNLIERSRENLFNYLQGKICTDCGETDIVVLEFDHLRDKEYNISYMVRNAMSWSRILKEIQKCEIVCSNCHTRRTAKRAGWYKYINSDSSRLG